ncbi:uncharacterized protein BO66DRAFT_397857 [Aspergillus aculeatinus CBS 121060]|uniref:Uncharacterized protein n=1 Tax=Aspergillus aculeatinus CBS 121060 TaxID=1448322 RepID=A0ACD1HMB8_9EURO|nr:hypothetical protein BO66DRAFT_397857 [Aspergillus aculeatinus CBS 121060]RAH74612.1 hypothetical protein BO66DRAFT_397857 [Aspergillus aculeatinus CBS 121060]
MSVSFRSSSVIRAQGRDLLSERITETTASPTAEAVLYHSKRSDTGRRDMAYRCLLRLKESGEGGTRQCQMWAVQYRFTEGFQHRFYEPSKNSGSVASSTPSLLWSRSPTIGSHLGHELWVCIEFQSSDLASRNGAKNRAGKARGVEGVVQKQPLLTDSMVVVSCTHAWASKEAIKASNLNEDGAIHTQPRSARGMHHRQQIVDGWTLTFS